PNGSPARGMNSVREDGRAVMVLPALTRVASVPPHVTPHSCARDNSSHSDGATILENFSRLAVHSAPDSLSGSPPTGKTRTLGPGLPTAYSDTRFNAFPTSLAWSLFSRSVCSLGVKRSLRKSLDSS